MVLTVSVAEPYLLKYQATHKQPFRMPLISSHSVQQTIGYKAEILRTAKPN